MKKKKIKHLKSVFNNIKITCKLGKENISVVSCSVMEFNVSSCSDTIEHKRAGPINIGNWPK